MILANHAEGIVVPKICLDDYCGPIDLNAEVYACLKIVDISSHGQMRFHKSIREVYLVEEIHSFVAQKNL